MTSSQAPFASKLRLLVLGVVGVAVALALSRANSGRALSLLAEVGVAGLLMALLPSLVSVLFEIASWRRALVGIGYRATFFRLFLIRVASESLSLCLPGGVVLAESMKLPLFAQHTNFGAAQAIVAMTLRKYLVLMAQAAYLLAAGLLLSIHHSAALSRLSVFIFAAAGVLATLAFASRALLAQGASIRSLTNSLERWPFPRLQQALSRNLERLRGVTEGLSAFFRGGHDERVAVALAFASWAAEAVETFVLLRLVSCHVGFGEVAAMEATLSLLRSLLVFLPAGIGVQDAGYAFFLRALGVADAAEVAIAFALLKRSKELVWVLAGFALLAPSRRAKEPVAERVSWGPFKSKASW